MLESTSALAVQANMLIVSWITFRGSDLDPNSGILGQITDTRRGPKSVGDLRDLATHPKMYAEMARKYIAAPGYSELPAEVRRDLVAIAEEMEAALAELDDEIDPDKKWTKISRGEKVDATARLRVGDDAVEKFRSRLRGDTRKQKAQPEPPGQDK